MVNAQCRVGWIILCWLPVLSRTHLDTLLMSHVVLGARPCTQHAATILDANASDVNNVVLQVGQTNEFMLKHHTCIVV